MQWHNKGEREKEMGCTWSVVASVRFRARVTLERKEIKRGCEHPIITIAIFSDHNNG